MAKWISILLGITIGLSNSLRAEDEVWIQQGVRLEKVGATLVDASLFFDVSSPGLSLSWLPAILLPSWLRKNPLVFLELVLLRYHLL